SELDNARSAFESSKAQYESARAAVTQSRENLENTEIRSPVDGVILARMISEGDLARTGEPAFEVANLVGFETRLFLPMQDWESVMVGQPVAMKLSNRDEVAARGVVSRISPQLNPNTGLGEVVVSLTDATRSVRQGVLVDSRITLETRENTVVIPRSAMIEQVETYIEPETNTVEIRRKYNAFVAIGDTLARQRELELGLEQGERVEVLQGLEPGEKLIVTGQRNLSDRDRIRIAGQARPADREQRLENEPSVTGNNTGNGRGSAQRTTRNQKLDGTGIVMKNLSRLAVKRPVTFLMASLILIGFGVFGLLNLRLNLYPDVSFPTVTVYTTYEGVAPEDMETLITRPIEESIGSVSGIERVRSQSSQGASVVRLNFSWGTDLFYAETEVRKRLDMIRRSLPQDADQPIVFSYDPNDEPVIVLTLTSSTRSPRELRTIATQQLEQRLERISGVASAATAGGYDRQINIRIRNADMRAYNLNIADIASTLRQENIQVPAGQLEEGETTYSLRTVGDFRNIDQISNTIVGSTDGNPVYLRNVARVEDGIAQPIGNVRVQGNDGVVINIYRQSDSNVVMAAGGVMNALDDLRTILPSGVQLDVLTNQADFIEMSISNLIRTGFQAVLLVMLMLLLFLRSGRSSLIVAISIPVSIIATFSIMHWADVSMNIISLSGLTLAVGLVVDNAVVVLENIFRFREDGNEGSASAVMGAQEVAGPVMVSTLTTLVVFLPVLFVPGIAGLLFRDLALTVSFALVVSVLVALTLIPVMASRFFSRETGRAAQTRDARDTQQAGAAESRSVDARSVDARDAQTGGTGAARSAGASDHQAAGRGIGGSVADGSGKPATDPLRRLMQWRRRSMITRTLSIPVFLVMLPLYPLYVGIRWLIRGIGSFFGNRVAPLLGRLFDRLENRYRRAIDAVLPRSGLVVLLAFALLGVSIPIFY
ncbi:MAG: efflux RND transporter permease subunit, partial [Bacteroidota bacterium]